MRTPNIDRIVAIGVRFNRVYAQSTVCGPSRLSAYTGRYMRSHGSTWNAVPLRIGEPSLGDHLEERGAKAVLVGKSHMTADVEGMAKLGVDPGSLIDVHVSHCGFEPFERDDGLDPDGRYDPHPRYADYLRSLGYLRLPRLARSCSRERTS